MIATIRLLLVEFVPMLMTTGQVHGGAIEIEDGTLPEGAKVTILVHEDNETFELTADDEKEILAAIAEADRGDTLTAASVLQDLRKK